MKKICFVFGLFLSVMNVAYGVTVCAKNNTYVGILKKNVSGTDGEYVDATKIWKVVFDYKTITGLAACNEITPTAGATKGTAQTNLFTSYTDAGDKCWCKMEPVTAYGDETGITSYWIYLDTYSDAASCASGCTSACMNAVKSDTAFRSAMFEAVW